MEKFDKLCWPDAFQLFNTQVVITAERYEKNYQYHENAKKANMNPMELDKIFKRLCASRYHVELLQKIAKMPPVYANIMEGIDRRLFEEARINGIPDSYSINADITESRLTRLNLFPLNR